MGSAVLAVDLLLNGKDFTTGNPKQALTPGSAFLLNAASAQLLEYHKGALSFIWFLADSEAFVKAHKCHTRRTDTGKLVFHDGGASRMYHL